MPQVTPGQVTPGANGAPKLYGTQQVESTIPFQERLMKLFKPQEFVTIKNISNQDVYWQYLPMDGETESFSQDGNQKMIDRSEPEMWMIAAGSTEVIVGQSAYRALDVMYKNWSASKTFARFNDPNSRQFDSEGKHLPKNFNFSDASAQEDFIAQAYIGKATPSFGPTNEEFVTPQPQIPSDPRPQSDEDVTLPSTDPNGVPAPIEQPDPSPTQNYAEPDKKPRIKSAKELANAK